MFSVATRRVLNNAAASVPTCGRRETLAALFPARCMSTIPPTMKVRSYYHFIGFIFGGGTRTPIIEHMHDRYYDAHAFILATERRQTLPRIAPPVRILSFRVAGCVVVSVLGRFPRVLLGGSAVRRAIICAIHRDQWRFKLLLMSARGNIFYMCGRFECVSFVRFDVIRGTITAHAHSQHVPASPIYMTEIQVLWNYSHSVFLNEISMP